MSDNKVNLVLEAEEKVLGFILHKSHSRDNDDVDCMSLIQNRNLTGEYFKDDNCRKLFNEIIEMHKKRPDFNYEMLVDDLTRRSVAFPSHNSPAEYIQHLLDASAYLGTFDHYLNVLMQYGACRMVTRRLSDYCHRLNASVNSPGFIGVGNSVEEFSNELLNMFAAKTQLQSWEAAVENVRRRLNAEIDQGLSASMGLMTGFTMLDEKLNGLKPGQLIILAASPSVGKTSLAMNIAENVVSGDTPRRVAIFSCEMSQEQLAERMVIAASEYDRCRVLYRRDCFHRTEQDDMREKVAAAIQGVAAKPLLVDDRPSPEVSQVRSQARHWHRREKLDLIVVDYLQLLKEHSKSNQGRQFEVASISLELKAMARELNVPVLALSQLSREGVKHTDGKPRISDLRDSGAIEQDADVVMLLSRPAKSMGDRCPSEERNIAYLEVAKNRQGATGEIKLKFDDSRTQFENLTAAEAERLESKQKSGNKKQLNFGSIRC